MQSGACRIGCRSILIRQPIDANRIDNPRSSNLLNRTPAVNQRHVGLDGETVQERRQNGVNQIVCARIERLGKCRCRNRDFELGQPKQPMHALTPGRLIRRHLFQTSASQSE